jgi:two-component system NtrC family sensor kinase
MNQQLQTVLDFIQESENISTEKKDLLIKALKKADSDLTISEFKLERTEKVKRTTGILLEETIEELEQKRKAIEETNSALTKSLEELKAAQAQLIHSEKMASLGELTAGIAHEIQNPLNFVNNFAEVSGELITELNEELDEGEIDEAKEISSDLKKNLEKINHHGKRASEIVKSMLEHSRQGDGKKEQTDINKLVDEYLRLAYHGLRAKDKSFNADFELDLDEALPKVNVVPQDIGRVLLNLINNAFQAVQGVENPEVVVSSNAVDDKVELSVSDNGPGIPDEIKDKIFQPFFTTKPTGQGTGLGLSMSYDIITKGHGGKLTVESIVHGGAIFTVILPLDKNEFQEK